MASTKKPSDAFDYCKTMIKNMPFQTVETQILDDVNKMMWMAAPWRWTIGFLPSVNLLANTQDYAFTMPADFLYGYNITLSDQSGGLPRDILIVPQAPVGGIKGQPTMASITGTPGGAGTIRFYPVVGDIPATGWASIALYKKIAPTITSGNQGTGGTLIFDDEWFWVYESGVLWQAYLYGDDQRAGGAQVEAGTGKINFTGQRGVFEANLEWMKQREKLAVLDGRDEVDKLDTH